MADGALTVHIDDALAAEVRSAAESHGVSVDAFVRDALAHYIDDDDPAIDQRIIDDALQSGDTIPLEAVRPWIESWGKPGEAAPPKWPR